MSKRPSLTVRRPANAREFRALAELGAQAFNMSREPTQSAQRWYSHIGRANLRVIKRGRHVLGSLGILYFRQWFGGRSIPSAGISAVAVSPDARGAGVGTELMRAVISGLRSRGVPLSSLYPSTYPLYRAVGYEPAGDRIVCELELHGLGAQDRSLNVRPMNKGDHKAVYRLHREFGRRETGVVDRTPREWTNIFELERDPLYAYVIEAPGRRSSIEGYVTYTQGSKPEVPYEVRIGDHAFVTPAAGRRLLALFADHGTMARHVVYDGGHPDPLAALTRLECLKVRSNMVWMLRIIDVPKALRARGYPRDVEVELHLEISDDVLAENAGRFVLSVSNGKGRVRKGGRGRVKLGVRGLAPLFSGYFSAAQLAAAGLIEGGASDLASASTVFAGPRPWMNDRF